MFIHNIVFNIYIHCHIMVKTNVTECSYFSYFSYLALKSTMNGDALYILRAMVVAEAQNNLMGSLEVINGFCTC